MSGISGFVQLRFSSYEPQEALRSMADGLVSSGDQRSQLELARLFASATWLSTKKPALAPSVCSNGMFVFLNEPILNRDELLRSLTEKERPSPQCHDTELLARLFEVHREKMCGLLRGSLAPIIYDPRSETLFIVRDRFGLVNYYWALTPDAMLFATSPKSILRHPAFEKRIDPVAVRDYIVWGFVPAPRSIYTSMEKLPPASWLMFQPGRPPQTNTWWEFGASQSISMSRSAKRDAAVHLASLMEQATIRAAQSASAVPGTIFDATPGATLLSALLKKALGPKGFKVSGLLPWSEYRRRSNPDSLPALARDMGIFPTVEGIELQTVALGFPSVVARMAEPLADATIAPLYFQTRFLAQQGVSTALLPDGGIYSGLEPLPLTYLRIMALLDRLPKALTRAFLGLADSLLEGLVQGPRTKETLNLLARSDLPRPLRALFLKAYTHVEQANSLMTPGALPNMQLDPILDLKKRLERTTQRHESSTMVAISSAVGPMSMLGSRLEAVAAASQPLELLLPLLDDQVVDFCSTLPPRLGRAPFALPSVPQLAFRQLVPKPVRKQLRSSSLQLPTSSLSGEFKSWIDELTGPHALQQFGFLSPAEVRLLWTRHLNGDEKADRSLWAMLTLLIWLNENS